MECPIGAASEGGRGNPHTKPGRVGFELGCQGRSQAQEFAQYVEGRGRRIALDKALTRKSRENKDARTYDVQGLAWANLCGPLPFFDKEDDLGRDVYWHTSIMRELIQRCIQSTIILVVLLPAGLWGQTDCEAGNGLLDFAPPKTMSVQEVIQKFGAVEAATKEARLHYTYKQDVLVQTLSGKDVTGEFHEVTSVSYDEKGKRQEEVTFAAQNSLRGVQLTQEDMEDIRIFMPLALTSEDLPQYSLTYAGQQHVDDLDTYEFHVEPKKEEKGRRYFQGRIWVDAQDFQIVKVCGKSGPERVRVKKHQEPDLRPMFVTYRQQVDGRYWFPAYTRSDDTLRFKTGSVHVRETVKFSGYKRAGGR